MDTIIKTNHRTFSKSLKLEVAKKYGATKFKKKHVAGAGYVLYFYNQAGDYVANACKDAGFITLRIK